jgi:hypothetical protein
MNEAVSAAAAAGSAAALSARPPGEVVIWSIVGGLVAVWLSKPSELELSIKWALGVIGLFFVSAAAGVVLSAILVAVAPTLPPMFAFVAAIPRWASAAVIAALIWKLGPFAWNQVLARFGKGPHAD